MNLYFVRHGESEANRLHIFSNRPGQYGLTELGRRQARAVAAALRGKPLARIYTSPLLRAVQTAEILSAELDLPFEVNEALREYDVGVLEGETAQNAWDLYWQNAHDWHLRGLVNARIPEGESLMDIRARFMPFWRSLFAGPSQDTVLVGHGGTFRTVLPLVTRNISYAFALENGMANTAAVRVEDGAFGPVCTEWCGQTLLAVYPETPPLPADGFTIERVLAFNDALNAADVDGMMARMTEDCVFENTGPFPDGTRFEGRAAVRSFWEDFFRGSAQARIDVEQIYALGERCAMRWRYQWTDRAGQPGHIRGADLYRLANGLIAEKLSYVKG